MAGGYKKVGSLHMLTLCWRYSGREDVRWWNWKGERKMVARVKSKRLRKNERWRQRNARVIFLFKRAKEREKMGFYIFFNEKRQKGYVIT